MKRTTRGFSLIELMITVGIAGILASIAIPSFMGFSRRAKVSERKIVVAAIMHDVTANFAQTNRWPWGTGPGSTTWNPPLPTNGVYTKEKWVSGDPTWSNVTFSTEQPLWCRYLVHTGSPDTVLYVDVKCDLDADGDVCTYAEGYSTATNSALSCQSATPDPDCAGHVPASAETFGDNDCAG